MRRSVLSLAVALLFLLLTAVAYADPAANPPAQPATQQTTPAVDPNTPEEIPEIEVEVVGSHEWPAKVETVTAEDAKKMVNAQFIGNVIERLPGVDTLHGCLMGAHLITIRGNNSEWTQLMLEGIPLSPIGRPYILSFVPMGAIDTVRILTGPVPPKYCGTTIAGLVLLDMKTGDRYPGVQLNTTIGGYGEQIYDLNIGGGKPDRSYFVSFTHNETEGWMPHSDMNFNFISGKFVLKPDAKSRLTLVGADVTGNKNGPRPLGPNPVDKWAAEWTDVKQPKAAITYERQLDTRSDIMLRYTPTWFSGTQTWSQWFTNHTEQRFMPWEYDLFRTEAQYNYKITPEKLFTVGGCWQEDTYKFTDALKLSYWNDIPDSKRHSYSKTAESYYAQYTQPTSPTGTITVGGRYDTEDPGKTIVSPFVSWFKHLSASDGLRLAFTRNHRYPNLSELYGQGVWVGNPGLQPEMGWTYQVDYTHNLRNGALSLSVYDSELEDLISADSHNVYNNIGEGRLRGAEFAWQSNWRKGTYWFNYTYLDTLNKDTGDPLIAAFRTAFPRNSAKAGVTLKDTRGGEHSLEVLAYGPRRTDVDKPTWVGAPWNVTVPTHLPGFTWVNYKYTWPLGDQRSLTLAVENIFNVKAQDLLFYPRPGRWVSGSLNWHF
jgi:outer membrane cobalamin receptor